MAKLQPRKTVVLFNAILSKHFGGFVMVSLVQVEYIGDGFTRQFPILFDYIYPEEIQVLVQGALQEYLIDSGAVRLAVTPSVGSKVTVQRNTDARNPAHRFAHGSPLLPAYLDANFRQALHAVQEAITDAADNTEIARAELQLAVDALELTDVQLQEQIDLLKRTTYSRRSEPDKQPTHTYRRRLEHTTSGLFTYLRPINRE